LKQGAKVFVITLTVRLELRVQLVQVLGRLKIGGHKVHRWRSFTLRPAPHVHIVIKFRYLRAGEPVAEYCGLAEYEQRLPKILVSHQQVAYEHVAFALIHVGARGGMPAKMVTHGAAGRALEPSHAVDEGVLIYLNITGIKNLDSRTAVNEHITRADSSLGYL